MKKERIVARAITKIAEKVGQKSIDSACVWWACQPKVPASMMKKNEKKD